MAKNSTSFKKGESGNPNGRPTKSTSLTELMQEFLNGVPEKQKKTYKEIFVQKCFHIAIKGDVTAMKEAGAHGPPWGMLRHGRIGWEVSPWAITTQEARQARTRVSAKCVGVPWATIAACATSL